MTVNQHHMRFTTLEQETWLICPPGYANAKVHCVCYALRTVGVTLGALTKGREPFQSALQYRVLLGTTIHKLHSVAVSALLKCMLVGNVWVGQSAIDAAYSPQWHVTL